MALFRLTFLLQVGLLIGSNLSCAEGSSHRGEGTREAAGGAHAQRRRLLHPPAVAAELPQELEERLPKVVAAFLHSGNSAALRHANCSRRYELTSLRGRSHGAPQRSMSGALDAVLQAANFLNLILQANRSREQSLQRDVEWYHALVRSILEGDSKIHRAVVTFGPEASMHGPAVLLQATRAGEEIVLQDLSSLAQRLHNRTADTGWYHDVRDAKKLGFHKRVLIPDLRSADGPGTRGESFLPDRAHVRWSAPYLECEKGNLVPRWLLTLSAAFYGLKDDRAPEFRGVVRVDVNLQDVDIDQCSSEGWFAGTHRCNVTTMECSPIHGHGFVLDKYSCRCKAGFYHPNRVAVNSFARTGRRGTAPESGPNADEGSSNDCLPCQQGCAYCKDDTPCVAREDGALRLAVLSFQCLCLLLVFLSMVLVYHFRRNKSIRASGLVLLEAILCGALLLYFPVGILYFQPSVFRCILLRWVRLLGFATVYGTLTLKLYRVLKVFLSRTAQRIPYMTSWRVLRLLAIILLLVCWFLVAWTAAVCQHPDRKWALIDVGYTPDGLQFSMCLLDRWDYMTAVAEFLFLLWAVYLCYAVRTVPSAFHEPRYMAIAVHNELVLSAIFYVIRFTLVQELHPDWMLLLFFTHTHLTVTVTLGLLLVPKFLFAGTHTRDDMASEAYEDELDMGRSGSYLNSSITSAWSEHSLDPEDIREELKKLYSQLEIYKRKKMLANNPHLPKKRSSKKGLGRSLMRRITEIPESVHRQCSREEKEVGEHASNRNSVCALKKNPADSAHVAKAAKEETLKSKVFSLKKSHSSYDHGRDQSKHSKMEVSTAERSPLDTLAGKRMEKKSSENLSAPSESTESVPLVCKSASAHNLSADKKAVHARASMLQKSLSVITSAKERTLGLTTKAQSSEDSSKKSRDSRASTEPEHQAQPQVQAQGKARAQVQVQVQTPAKAQAQAQPHPHPQSHAQAQAKAQVQAQPQAHPQVQHHPQAQAQTQAQQNATKGRMAKQPTSSSDLVKGKDLYDLSKVCPWEVEDLPTLSENKVQKHVSIAPKESTTVHGGATKGGKAPPQKQKGSEQTSSTGRPSAEAQWTSAMRVEVCPWEDESRSPEASKQQSLNQASRAASNHQPQPAPEAGKSSRVDVCPWDFQEPPKTADRPTDTNKQRRGISPVEAKGQSAAPELSRATASLQIPPTRADVCPWEYHDTAASPPSEQRTPSPSQSSTAKEAPSRKKESPSRTAEKEKSRREEKGRTKEKEKIKEQRLAEVCPWEVDSSQETLAVEKRRSATVGAAKAKPAEVCPWDFQDTSEKRDRAVKASNPVPVGAANKADVCPWDFEDSTSSKKA